MFWFKVKIVCCYVLIIKLHNFAASLSIFVLLYKTKLEKTVSYMTQTSYSNSNIKTTDNETIQILNVFGIVCYLAYIIYSAVANSKQSNINWNSTNVSTHNVTYMGKYSCICSSGSSRVLGPLRAVPSVHWGGSAK